MLNDLVVKRLTIREIAASVGCSFTNVRYWLGKHGLKTFSGPICTNPVAAHCCGECGETNPLKFYGKKKFRCAACHNAYTTMKGREKRDFAIDNLGGKCENCGFYMFRCSLDVHHVDPKLKDPAFSHMRGWSIARLSEELKKCILLCRNCHAAFHGGELELHSGSWASG